MLVKINNYGYLVKIVFVKLTLKFSYGLMLF